MTENIVEFGVAGIILVTGLGITAVMLGADPDLAVSLIGSATELGIYIILVGVLVSFLFSLFR